MVIELFKNEIFFCWLVGKKGSILDALVKISDLNYDFCLVKK